MHNVLQSQALQCKVNGAEKKKLIRTSMQILHLKAKIIDRLIVLSLFIFYRSSILSFSLIIGNLERVAQHTIKSNINYFFIFTFLSSVHFVSLFYCMHAWAMCRCSSFMRHVLQILFIFTFFSVAIVGLFRVRKKVFTCHSKLIRK